MMIPKIIFSDKILDRIGIFMPIGGITLYPFIILRERYKSYYQRDKLARVLRHENIHIEQQKELLIIPFYIWYVLEYILKLFKYGSKAYRNLSFEREAYQNENDLLYLSRRKRYSFLKYI